MLAASTSARSRQRLRVPMGLIRGAAGGLSKRLNEAVMRLLQCCSAQDAEFRQGWDAGYQRPILAAGPPAECSGSQMPSCSATSRVPWGLR